MCDVSTHVNQCAEIKCDYILLYTSNFKTAFEDILHFINDTLLTDHSISETKQENDFKMFSFYTNRTWLYGHDWYVYNAD